MNIFEGLDFDTDAELVTELLGKPAAGLRIERILSNGQTSEIYDQDENEWVVLFEGEAKIKIFGEEEREVLLAKGDSLWIPSHQLHQVVYTSKRCVWLCVFSSNPSTDNKKIPYSDER